MASTQSETPRPVEVGRANEHDVKIRWNDGAEAVYPARFLRMLCPCAMCVDEMTGTRTVKEDSVPKDVHPLGIDPVGRYAIQIFWSDAHNTGIYTWDYLWRLIPDLPPSKPSPQE